MFRRGQEDEIPVEHQIDEAARRVIVSVGPDVRGEAVSRRILELAATRPGLAGWDWIHDIRESSGDVGNPDVAVVAEAFAAAGPGRAWTVFVTHDRHFDLWCRVMDAQFPGRTHLTAPTMEAAVRQLDRLRSIPAPLSS